MGPETHFKHNFFCNFFFFVNNEKIGLPRRLCGKKKCQKILCLKCVSDPIEPKKYIHQKQNFFSPLRGFGLRIFSMFRKKICFGEIMFKMCFRPHRTQKIYSLKTKFFFLNNEKIGVWT